MHASRFAPVLLVGLMSAPLLAQFQPWQVVNGSMHLRIEQAGLSGAGLKLVAVEQTGADAGAVTDDGAQLSLVLAPQPDFTVLQGHSGEYVAFGVLGGGADLTGGFTLASPSTHSSVDFHDARFHFLPAHTDGPGGAPEGDYLFITGPGGTPGHDLILRTPKIHLDMSGSVYGGTTPHALPSLNVVAWDLVIGDGLAARLHRPDLAGLIIGDGQLLTSVVPFEGPWSYPPGLNPWTALGSSPPAGPGPADAGLDVKLATLGTIVQKVHTGIFPNGRQSMACTTTACNVGTTSIPWKQAMDPNHPGISQQLYRMMGDRFEQVGVAWIKHGFFATNQNNCATCTTPGGPGNQLGVNCSDTYATSNNADPMWLGPRSEWNAFTDVWEPCGSFFDGTPVDCQRSENGSSYAGKVDHRLEAFDYDLGLPGAQYFYEAFYMPQGDIDITNNIASRECTTTWNGSTSWQISPAAGPGIQGPAINRWGDERTQVGLEPADGHVIVGVKTRDLGNGTWRYEYAVFNWNLDRKLRAFSVPTGGGNVSDFYFHDIDDQPSNDWVPAVSNGNLTWTFPDVFLTGVKVAGPLEFGTLYNFGFTCDVAPGDRNAALTVQDPGAGGNLMAAATQAPAALNLTATKLAPAVGENFDLQMHGGTANMLVAVMAVNGVSLGAPALLGPIPFVSGEASLTLSMPALVTGLSFDLVGGDVSVGPLHLIKLANFISIDVQ
jgi:hypothetical protein